MTKQELFDAFDGKISKASIVDRDGEFVIQGKFCVIAPEGENVWDIWIGSPDDLYSGLSQRKVTGIITSLQKSAVGSAVRELTGEADTRVRGTGLILSNLRVLGIRKKREISPEAREKLRLRLSVLNSAKKEVRQ